MKGGIFFPGKGLDYVRGLAKRGSEADRLKGTGQIPSLATIIRERERE